MHVDVVMKTDWDLLGKWSNKYIRALICSSRPHPTPKPSSTIEIQFTFGSACSKLQTLHETRE